MSDPASIRQGAAPERAPLGWAQQAHRRRSSHPQAHPNDDTLLAAEIRDLVHRDLVDRARERFADLVARQQQRALRIAYHYLRDAAEADEAVQDAFAKVFTHIGTFQDAWPFEAWFTRILVNGCLDRRRAARRRGRWSAPKGSAPGHEHGIEERRPMFAAVGVGDPEAQLLADERFARLARAVDGLRGRQRTVFVLCHLGDRSPREVSAMTGLNESTVRVHLFRAVRRLRALLGERS